jgi:CBS domain-containing protein
MNSTIYTEANNRLVLLAKTAEDLMTVNPVSVREDATIPEAIAFLTAAGFSAAPVINEAGQPVGVVSKTDLLRQAIDAALEPAAIQAGHDGAALMCDPQQGQHGPFCQRAVTVGEIMTPAIVAVPRSATLAQVAAKMTARRVHRVFVLDKTGALVGVVSSLDILRALCD